MCFDIRAAFSTSLVSKSVALECAREACSECQHFPVVSQARARRVFPERLQRVSYVAGDAFRPQQ